MAELTAIGEVMHWLLETAPDHGTAPVHLRYDSIYAANIARGIWEPKSNEELAETVRALTSRVMEKRTLTFEWVRGHSGSHDNELADRAADLGRRGRTSVQSKRWTAPPPGGAGHALHGLGYLQKVRKEILLQPDGRAFLEVHSSR